MNFIVRVGSLALFLLFTFLIVPAQTSHSDGSDRMRHDSKVILVSIPGLSFAELLDGEWQTYPHIAALIRSGAVGGMNVRTKERGVEDSYLSMGLGRMATAPGTIQAYSAKEDLLIHGHAWTVAEWYRALNGDDGSQRDAQVWIPEMAGIAQGALDHGAASLGDLLTGSGIPVYVYGNLDERRVLRQVPVENGAAADWKRRQAALMLMDRNGLVPFGDVGGHSLLADKNRPFGIGTNYDWMSKQLHALPPTAVALFELGDLSRLHRDPTRFQSERRRQLERQAMFEIDQWIGQTMQSLQASDMLFVFSPYVHNDAYRSRLMLAPIIRWQPDAETDDPPAMPTRGDVRMPPRGDAGGILTSPTTRRAGIVSMYDLAPTILAVFDIPPDAGMIGRSMVVERGSLAFETLEQSVRAMQTIYRLRPKLLYPFVSYEISVLLIGLLAVLFALKEAGKWLYAPLFSLLLAPLWMLAMGWMAHGSSSTLTGMFLIGLAVSGVAVFINTKWFIPLTGWIGAIGATVIVVDIAAGSYAMKHSILGYDAMIGARYYGIGNEFMGVLIGSVVLAVSVMVQIWSDRQTGASTKRMKLAIAPIFVIILLVLASPSLGTNAGGAITAGAAFGTLWVRMFIGHSGWHRSRFYLLLYVVMLILLSLLALGWLNMWHGSNEAEQSHIGRALQTLSSGRIDLIGEMIARKLTMNWHLIVVSSWSKVLITSLIVMGVVLFRPLGVFRRWQSEYPYFMYGFSANTAGALVALAVNDSGIVAAATMIVYVAVPMLLLKLSAHSSLQSSNNASHS